MDLNLKKAEEVRRAKVIITTEDGGDGGDAGEGGDGGDDNLPDDSKPDDIASLFTPEEIAAQKERVTTLKAEETRRAALSPEDLAAEDQAKTAADAKNVVPEKYEAFKLPDGTEPDPEIFEKWGAFAKEKGFTQAQMEEVTAEGSKLFNEIRQKQFEGIKATWLKDAQTDPEIGEDVKKGAESAAARAFNTIASDGMKALMDQYGLGNHPEVLRMFFRLSKSFKEDGFEVSGLGAGLEGKGADKTAGSIFNHPSRNKG